MAKLLGMLKPAKRFRPVRLVALLTGLALILSMAAPAAAATTPPVQITLGGSGATPWNIGNIAPGQSGTKIITVQNTGLYNGDLTMWISNIVNTEGTPPQFQSHGTGDLGAYLAFKVTSTRLSSNFTMPAILGAFPANALDTHYLKVYTLRPAELVTLTWQWNLPAGVGNIVQGDGLSFDINYMLEQAVTPPPTTTVPPVTTTTPPTTTTAVTLYRLTIRVNGIGTTDPQSMFTQAGDKKYLTAIPNPGNHFVNWTGDVDNRNSASTFIIMNSDETVTANFAPDVPATTVTTTPPPATSPTTTPPVTTTGGTTAPPATTVVTTTPASGTGTPTTSPVTTTPVIPTTTIESQVYLDLSANLDAEGYTTGALTIYTGDMQGSIYIPAGTRLVDSSGNPLLGITLYTYSDPGDVFSVVLIALPSGAVFSQPLTLVMHYDESRVTAEQENELGIYVQSSDGVWHLVPGCVVDDLAATITVRISHFGIYAVRLPAVENPPFNNWWLVGGVGLATILLLMFVIVLRVRKKSDRHQVYVSKKVG